ncbi:MAG: S1C family serine protease [Actinomycetes bacterium]
MPGPDDQARCRNCGVNVRGYVGAEQRETAGAQPPGRSRAVVGAVSAAAVLALVIVVGGGAFLLRSGDRTPTGGTATTDVTATSLTAEPGQQSTANPSPSSSTPSPLATSTATPSGAPTASFAAMFDRDRTGVIRITTTACDGGGVGSGFLVAPDLVATVAHVVEGAQVIGLESDNGEVSDGRVVGYDLAHEVALVRAATPFSGHVFDFSPSSPQVGDDIAVVGYPLGGELSLAKGAISGLHRQITTEESSLDNVIQTDAAINHGNSGGPLLGADGLVVALAEAIDEQANGLAYAVPADTAAAEIRQWRQTPEPPTIDHCDAPVGPDEQAMSVVDDTDSSEGSIAVGVLQRYVDGINSGNYRDAYEMLDERAQRRFPFQSFEDGNATSYLLNMHVRDVTETSEGRLQAQLSFVSVQDADYGYDHQSCSVWTATYTFAEADGDWLIDEQHAAKPDPC